MNSTPKHVSFCLESTQFERYEPKPLTTFWSGSPLTVDRLDHVLFLIENFELAVVGSLPKRHLDRVTVEPRFKRSAVLKLDRVYGKQYTTSVYNQAFTYCIPLATHLNSLFDGQQRPLFRASYDRCRFAYSDPSVLEALARWPTGDQLLRWALAPSSGVWPPEISCALRARLRALALWEA